MVSALQIYSGLLRSFFRETSQLRWAGFYSAGSSSSTSVQAHMGVIVSTAVTVLKGRHFFLICLVAVFSLSALFLNSRHQSLFSLQPSTRFPPQARSSFAISSHFLMSSFSDFMSLLPCLKWRWGRSLAYGQLPVQGGLLEPSCLTYDVRNPISGDDAASSEGRGFGPRLQWGF